MKTTREDIENLLRPIAWEPCEKCVESLGIECMIPEIKHLNCVETIYHALHKHFTQWIPTTERLPEDKQLVLICKIYYDKNFIIMKMVMYLGFHGMVQ